MAEFIVSVVAEMALEILEHQIREEIDLVQGVEGKICHLSREMRAIRNVLEDAERREYTEKNVKDWLRRLQDTSHEMDDVLDEWNFAILEHHIQHHRTDHVAAKQNVPPSSFFFPSLSSCLCLKKVVTRRDIAKKIKKVKEKLDEILKEKDRYGFSLSQPNDHFGGLGRVQSTSFVSVEDICGRDCDKEELLRKVLHEGYTLEQSGSTQIISLVGLGGIGKTTLAQMVYNDDRVQRCYPLTIWICVSTPFNVVEIAKGIIEKVQGSCPDTHQLDSLLGYLRNCIAGKKVLLVLDDVWAEQHREWEPLIHCLKSCGEGSTILVTTRNERVAGVMGTTKHDLHRIGLLSDDDCWLILSRIALPGMREIERENLEEIGWQIARKCKGLPLAAKAIGSMLYFKHKVGEWQTVLDSEIWKLQVAEVELFPHLFLSYNDLTPALKACFSYCAVFPRDHRIQVESLIMNWLALGYLSSDGSASESQFRGREFFNNLAMRSLFQEFERDRDDKDMITTCKMHDLVHDFAQFLRKDAGDVRKCPTCSPSLLSSVNKYRSLFLDTESILPYFCDCLIKLRLLSLRGCGLKSIPKEIEKLIHLRYLDLEGNRSLSVDDLRIICKLYNLKILILRHCRIEKLPNEIGDLIKLRHLDLCNGGLDELPESICNLKELESLDLAGNNFYYKESNFLSEWVGQLIGLQMLKIFAWKLSHLKNLNQLSQSLTLLIRIPKGVEDVDEAREAEMGRKVHLRSLNLIFRNYHGEENVGKEQVWRDVLDALRPHQKLDRLRIEAYGASILSDWITSPVNQTRKVVLVHLDYLSLLPPLGRLQFLEELKLYDMRGLEFVGRDFLGMTAKEDTMEVAASSSSATMFVGFPKLKMLGFYRCPKWKEWEDITNEEEASRAVSLFPYLKVLHFQDCSGLLTLPHRLLCKASSLEELNIQGSPKLLQRYDKRKEGSHWDSISHIARIVFW